VTLYLHNTMCPHGEALTHRGKFAFAQCILKVRSELRVVLANEPVEVKGNVTTELH
jgi:hypothetical protein